MATRGKSVDALLAKLDGVRRGSTGWTSLCPGHDDRQNSLSIRKGDDERVLLHCFAGCTAESVVAAIGLTMADLFAEKKPVKRKGNASNGYRGDKVTSSTPERRPGLDTATLAAAKKLPVEELQGWGVSDSRYKGKARVEIPYADLEGNTVAVRYRTSLNGDQRFLWRKGDRVTLYGLGRYQQVRAKGRVTLFEGESDTWTAWHHGVPALGIPGKSTWRAEWAKHVEGLDVYLWQEPGASDLSLRVLEDVPDLKVIQAPAGVKDVSEAHIQGQDVAALMEECYRHAVPAVVLKQAEVEARLASLRMQAERVLDAQDPLVLVRAEIRALGLGGDITPAVITYVSVTSRLIGMRHGAMPVHLLLLGATSAGKSYTLQTVLKLLPPEAYHTVDAGSPRVLIYDTSNFEHKALVFGEADSLPASEDNPAASAVRNLLQDHYLHYQVTVRDPETGDFAVRDVRKEGPTVLITTAVRSLGEQLGSRLFVLEMSESAQQIRDALDVQASLELHGATDPDPALVAFQEYLQAQAPWDVVVPFVEDLSKAIGETASAPRILRDWQRLISLVKAVAILRHHHRCRDKDGRLVAELADYEAVFDLVGEMYESSVTGLSQTVAEVVKKVNELHDSRTAGKITFSAVAKATGIHRDLARRRANRAIRQGWLVNNEKKDGAPADLKPGEPLPIRTGLPKPGALPCHPVTPLTDGNSSDVEHPVDHTPSVESDDHLAIDHDHLAGAASRTDRQDIEDRKIRKVIIPHTQGDGPTDGPGKELRI